MRFCSWPEVMMSLIMSRKWRSSFYFHREKSAKSSTLRISSDLDPFSKIERIVLMIVVVFSSCVPKMLFLNANFRKVSL